MIHTLAFGAQDAAGNVLPAGNPVTLIVDTLPPAMPIVTSVDPNGTLVSGTADAGSTVIIRSGSTILGRGVADGSGIFSVTISPAQTAGESLNAIAQIQRVTKAEKHRLPPQYPAFRTRQLLRSWMT